MLSLVLLSVALVLVVTGAALASVPAALVTAGIGLAAVALFIDFDRKDSR